jgi:hypothetical protein
MRTQQVDKLAKACESKSPDVIDEAVAEVNPLWLALLYLAGV